MPDPVKTNKTIREIRKENRDEEKIFKDLSFLLDPEKVRYKPIKTVGAFNNNFIQCESIGDKDKNLSSEEYIDINRPYLSDIINNHKTQGEWKIHITIASNFSSSKDSGETCAMYTKNDNIGVMMGSETDEIIKELFESLLQRHQERLEESMKGCEFTFNSVDVLYYNLNKINLNRGGSYIDSTKWLKNKKAKINPKINDDKYFQHALTDALNYEQIKSHPERISNIKPFIDRYNWKGISFPSDKKDWKSLN